MSLAEKIAESVGVEKVMLTCFIRNVKARQFYEHLGYAVDESSPADRKTRNKVVKADYVIMSKRVRPRAQGRGETEQARQDAIRLKRDASLDMDVTADQEGTALDEECVAVGAETTITKNVSAQCCTSSNCVCRRSDGCG